MLPKDDMVVSRITKCMSESGHGVIDWITECVLESL
jgi:hypothetical protein